MNNFKKTTCFILFFVTTLLLHSQSSGEDSLLYYYSQKTPPTFEQTQKFNVRDTIAAFILASKISNNINKTFFYHHMGQRFYSVDNYDIANIYYTKALETSKRTGNKAIIAKELSALGDISRLQDKNTIALNLIFQSINLYRELKDTFQLAHNLSLVGDINRCLEQLNDATHYLTEALSIAKEKNYTKVLTFCYSSLGTVYYDVKKYKEALFCYNTGLAISTKAKDTMRIVDFLYAVGNVLIDQDKPTEALFYLYRGVNINKKVNDNYHLSLCLMGLAKANLKEKKYSESITYGLQSFEIGKQINSPGIYGDASEIIYKAYLGAGNYKEAFNFLKINKEIHENTINSIQIKKQAQLEINFLNAFKEKQESILRAEKQKQKDIIQLAKTRQQQAYIVAGSVLLLTVIAIAIVLFRFYQKERDSKQIIKQQHLVVKAKNKEILDSINYAQKIQQTIIPSIAEVKNIFPNCFALLLPKAIVSGDFYWLTQKEDYTFVAVADCTGHGVPGGFMSMLGIALLNEVINEKKEYNPCDILDLLKAKIILALRQTENASEAKDGMDIALCRINKTNMELSFAGANNSVHIIRDNKIIELKGDKQPIGIYHTNKNQFTQQCIQLDKNDTIYMFTDGFPDQFGGASGKKYKYKNLEELLLSIHSKGMDDQQEILHSTFKSWKGALEQVDDICIMGIKI
ncbi:MAG: SpoIIE family protein phosphatase [Bacteroidia bacterium]